MWESDWLKVTWPQLCLLTFVLIQPDSLTRLCWGKINHAPFVLFASDLLLSAGMKRHTISIVLTLFCFADSLSKYCLNVVPLAVRSRDNTYSVKKSKGSDLAYFSVQIYKIRTHQALVFLWSIFHLPLGITMKFKALHILKGVDI